VSIAPKGHTSLGAVALLLVSAASQAQTQALPCGLLPPRLAGHAVEVRFTPATDWNVTGHSLSPEVSVRQGQLLYFPPGKNQVDDITPARLKSGERLSLGMPHESCSLQAVIGKVSSGLIVQEGRSHPGIPWSTTTDFIPVEKKP
jgi:hypothetical protein